MATQRYKVWCPFFIQTDMQGREIVCEGLVPGSTSSRQHFRDRKKMLDWMRDVCTSEKCGDRCLWAHACFFFYSDCEAFSGVENERRKKIK